MTKRENILDICGIRLAKLFATIKSSLCQAGSNCWTSKVLSQMFFEDVPVGKVDLVIKKPSLRHASKIKGDVAEIVWIDPTVRCIHYVILV